MTGELIVIANVVAAVAYLVLGAVFVWKGFSGFREWPVGAMVAIAGPYLLAGIVLVQLTIWRAMDNDGSIIGWEGKGTLVLRIAIAFTAFALARRVVFGSILTDGDRRRVRDP